jgi:single-stranded DNA-specific DHH superfamily exonuclease
MLTEAQIKEIREHLEKAQNPLFYYDNDADGLCSFLLLRRYLGRGKGVAIRSYPELHETYAKKAQELKADYVFILDKPVISSGFLEQINKMSLPIVWIDHHDMQIKDYGEKYPLFYTYNPALNQGKDKSFEPVSYLSYMISGKKEDYWISLMGCVADHYLPDFAKEFEKQYPEMWAKNIKEPFQAYFETELGKIAQSLNFGIKDSTSHIVQMQNFLLECNSPKDIFQETKKNENFRNKCKDIKSKYDKLVEKAQKTLNKNLMFFEYSGELSISSEISNELHHFNPKKTIAVAYKNGAIVNISLRGKNVKKILAKILPLLPHSSGGGHEDAVGARINLQDLDKFKELLEKEVN